MKFDTILILEYIEKYQSVWPNKTILDYLNDAIAKDPDKVAIIDKKSRYTYGELGKLVDRVALGLLELGIGKGDVISIQFQTGMSLLFFIMRPQELVPLRIH